MRAVRRSHCLWPGENITGYQWYLNGAIVPGATSATLQITSLTIAKEGVYTCVASNSVGSDTSEPAVVVSKRLMGWWKLDGNLAGLGRHGCARRCCARRQHHQSEFCCLGQERRRLRVPAGWPCRSTIADSNDFFNFYPQGLTVSAWVNTAQNGWGGIVANINNDDTTGFYLTHDGNWRVSGIRGLDGQWSRYRRCRYMAVDDADSGRGDQDRQAVSLTDIWKSRLNIPSTCR